MCFFINCIVLTSLLIVAVKSVGQHSSNVFMVVSPIFRALSTLTSSVDILPVTILRMPTSGCYALSTGFIDSSSLFLDFPRPFASDNIRDIISSLWRFLVDTSWWVISRMSFFIRQQMCRLKLQVLFDLVLSVMPIRPRGPLIAIPHGGCFYHLTSCPVHVPIHAQEHGSYHMFLTKVPTYFAWHCFG